VKAPKGYFSIIEFIALEPWQRTMFLNQLQDDVRSVASFPGQFVSEPRMALESLAQPAIKKVRRKKSAYSRRLSAELKKVNKAARTKSGRLRKGMTPGKILKKAHKAAKKASRRAKGVRK